MEKKLDRIETLYDEFYTNEKKEFSRKVRITSLNMDKLNEFKDVIRIFRDYPYYEILTDEGCKEELEGYQDNLGIAFGCYVEDELVGVNCIEYGHRRPDHSIVIPCDNSRIAYFSGLAMKENVREKGLGTLLVNLSDKYIRELKDENNNNQFLYSYARVLLYNSMSKGIFLKNGFEQTYANGKPIVDVDVYKCNLVDPDTHENAYHSDERTYVLKKYIK